MLIKIGCDSNCGLMEAKGEKGRGNFRDDDWKNEKCLLFPVAMERYCMRARPTLLRHRPLFPNQDVEFSSI